MFSILLDPSGSFPAQKPHNKRPQQDRSSPSPQKSEEKRETVDLDNLNPRALC